MADMTASRPGQADATGDSRALFLKKYGGEVLTAFRESNVFIGRHMVRTITQGKSAQFPATWKAVASYHTVGTQITGQVIKGNERTINLDDLLISPVFIASIDEAMSHFEFRREYSYQSGAALSRTFDKNVAQVGLLAARASATVAGANGGTQITAATAKTDATALIGACFDAAQAFDEKDVPESERFIFVKPEQYYLLVQSGDKAISTDYNPEGNGSLASGKIHRLAGMEIVKTNNLPQSLVNTGPTAYQGDFTNTAALVMQRGAVGTVKLIDLSVESEYLIEYQGTLIVAKMAVGHGILRPECAVEVKTA
jgi:P22 coat protein - gene protein 5.